MQKIVPTSEQFKELMALEYDGPIFMINLLKFKPEEGAETYARYIESSTKVFEEIGVKSIFRGKIAMPVIGDEDWDEIIIAEYPSIAAFIEMNSRLYLAKAEEA